MDLHVESPGLHLKSLIIPVSGCFGFSREFTELYGLSLLGGIAIESATPYGRFGNLTSRVAGTPYGILNAIGSQNPEVDVIMERELPWLAQPDTETVTNATGASKEKYVEVIARLDESEVVKAYKLNISYPNVEYGGVGLDTDPKLATNVTRVAKGVAERPVYVKLSPNTANIVEVTKAIEEAGVDSLALINILMGMRIDLYTGKPLPANVTGGLSGPAIKLVAVRMVHQAASAVNTPIIGVGGITRAEDVLEFLCTGANAAEVGMQNFTDSLCCVRIIRDLPEVLKKYGNNSLNDAVGGSFR